MQISGNAFDASGNNFSVEERCRRCKKNTHKLVIARFLCRKYPDKYSSTESARRAVQKFLIFFFKWDEDNSKNLLCDGRTTSKKPKGV